MMQTEMHKLAEFGVHLNKLKDYQVLCLPENFESSESVNDLHDAGSAIDFSKQLKDIGVRCANSFDLGIEAAVIDRRSADLWLGLVWVLDYVTVPFVVGVVSSLLASSVYDKLKSKRQVHLTLYLQKEQGLTKIRYDGDSETLKQILGSIIHDSIPAENNDDKR